VTERKQFFQNTWNELHFSELKKQQTRNAKLHVALCLYYLFVKRKVPKKTIIKNGHQQPSGFIFVFLHSQQNRAWCTIL